MDAAFAKIIDSIGEDVQEIDPDVGVGNVSKYVGPAMVPDGAKGKAFTAKVKILERQAATVGEHAPPVSVPGATRVSPSGGRARARAIVVAIAALGVVVAVGVWVVAQGPHAGSTTPAPSMSGAASSTPAAPAMSSSAAAVVVVPTAPPPPSLEVSEADAGAKVATAAAPYKPKGPVVKGEDPYDAAAPVPAKTVEPVTPPAPAVMVAPATVPTVAPRPLPTAPSAASSGRILGSDEE